MRELTPRERLLLGLLLLIGLAFGGVYVQKQLAGQEALLQQQLDNRRQQLRQLQALASEWNQLKNQPLAPVMEITLFSSSLIMLYILVILTLLVVYSAIVE